eukprot:jgi/Psemu1/209578/e_gw1.504.17.1
MAATTSADTKGGGGSSSSSSAKNSRQGVADYFTILGVGEDLVWMHAQQKEQDQQQEHQPEQPPNEDEEHPDDEPSSSPPSPSQQDGVIEPNGKEKPTTSTTTPAPAPAPAPIPKKPAIPEEDDAMLLERFYREIVTCDVVMEEDDDYDDKMETGTSVTNTSTLSAIASEGWTVVRNTRPAATNSNPIEKDGKRQRPPMPSLWDKGKTWDTNLDPIDGLTGEILRAQYQRDAEYKAELERIQSGRGKSGHDYTKTPLKDLRKRVQSTFQSKTQQWMLPHHSQPGTNANHSHSHIDSSIHHLPHHHHHHHPKRRRKFYLSYKRRSPDEPNVPAIADLALYYVRIHKATIVTDESGSDHHNFGRTAASPSSSSAAAADHHSSSGTIGGNTNTTNTTSTTTTTTARTHQVAAVASAVGRTGIRASAALLNAGRQAVSNRWSNHPGVPESYSWLRFPKRKRPLKHPEELGADNDDGLRDKDKYHDEHRRPIQTITALFPESNDGTSATSNSNQGVEAVDKTPDRTRRGRAASSSVVSSASCTLRYNDGEHDKWKERLLPRVVDPTDKDLLGIVGGDEGDGEKYHQAKGENLIVSGSSGSFDDINGYHLNSSKRDDYIHVPILAVRRQRIGDEERFFEDPALIDVSVTIFDERGRAVLPSEEYQFMTEEEMMEDENDDGEKIEMKLLHKTKWIESRKRGRSVEEATGSSKERWKKRELQKKEKATCTVGAACLIVRHNVPMGFCDAAFSTRVLDRFPYKNYKGLPLPEEELPMFCYPTGCRLYRAKFSDAPLPQYYGFVVKNERGDSIYVSCVSFMEPLTNEKKEQLSKLSEKRRRVSLPHKIYWARKQQRSRRKQKREQNNRNEEHLSVLSIASPSDWITVNEKDEYYDDEENTMLMAFDQMTTYENKTICLVSRYPYWTAFRRFLSHLHSVSGCSSDLPLERYISHLLLSVPAPKPGGPSILIPLPTFNVPMMISSPPLKDLPLVDLPFERLLACLDVPTIVTMVIGFLTLERKVIVMSKRPSLVLDVCECARALLFPFELVAPYVPRLTEPFMSCLEFPGAIFAGIHDDGTPDGLAAKVRQQMPEDSTIINLDTGNVDCSGDRMSVLNNSWGIIPPGPRSVLVSEIETLCRDASIVPGQEPLDGVLDPSFEASAPTTMVQDVITLSNEDREPLDDRAIRDAFLRFFCSVLVGYERFLVVPDVDFLISGNEWFDAKGFLDAASEEKALFLGTLVSTQLFQSFIQRRTEASDVHLLLFDECLQEYHSSSVPYGRLGGDVETVVNKESGKSQMLYSLLVDQAADESRSAISAVRSSDGDSGAQGSDTDNSSGYHLNKSISAEATERLIRYSEFGVNASGDWVTVPSRQDIPKNACFTYCVDGNPTFPDKLNQCFYVPRQPESWLVEMSTSSTPMLTRSGPEKEEAERRRRFSTSYRGLHNQRRCLWQLPKLMGSHFLGTWLLCIPTLVSQPNISNERQSRHLLRAFGALRLLRSRQKIVPDEAAYRALIVACGRTKNDRRAELVKLFGHLRSDGIFPSAVTLGQYTRALAEGYSKRAKLEQVVDEHGEQILDRERLRKNYPEIFYNLWWYCARFQLPLPLAVSSNEDAAARHCCAIISWDRQVAMRGCFSAAKILLDALPSEDGQASGSEEAIESLDDSPLLSKFNLSGYYSNVWDHPDLSEILVALVQACDKRDFRPVVEAVLRREGKNIDCYRTILYLAKYQCTSAFHAFFPATLKPCKGYHFWCPMVPLPIFDRLFREAVKRVRGHANNHTNAGVVPPIHEVQEVPLAFRSVFGHLM